MAIISIMVLDKIYLYWSSIVNNVTILLNPVLVLLLAYHKYICFRFNSNHHNNDNKMLMMIHDHSIIKFLYLFRILVKPMSFDWGETHCDESSFFDTVKRSFDTDQKALTFNHEFIVHFNFIQQSRSTTDSDSKTNID